MATAPVEAKSNQNTYQNKLKKITKEFEKACNQLKQPSTADERNEYKAIQDTTRTWPTHQNPNKKCKTAVTIIKPYHCSKKIRQKLNKYIPNNYPLNYCNFSKGAVCCPGFDINTFLCVYSVSLIALFSVAVDCDQKSAALILKQVIGSKQFDFILKASCNGNSQDFYVKMVGDAAFVKACGTSQRTDCMTFAPLIAIKLHEYGLLVLRATKGLLGVGFCNLIEDDRRKTKRKKPIKGNSMIMIRNDNIEHIETQFYGKNGIKDFGMSCESNNLSKNNYDNPLVLYSPTNEVDVEEKVQEQNIITGAVSNPLGPNILPYPNSVNYQ
eukprot:496962_1